MSRLGGVWSVLREPLVNSLTFAQIKEVAAGAGLPTVELSNLRQASSGSFSGTSKGGLVDALDGVFRKLSDDNQNRVAGHVVAELVRRGTPDQVGRLEELLERVGWQLVAGEPAPLALVAPPALTSPSATVSEAMSKSVRRFRDGDFDGAMTAIVGVIDTLTEGIYTSAGLPDHKRANYQQRALTAHNQLEAAFRARLVGMPPAEADLTWAGQHRAVNGAADVLGAFRRNFSDTHGAGAADPRLVQEALQSALFLVSCLEG